MAVIEFLGGVVGVALALGLIFLGEGMANWYRNRTRRARQVSLITAHCDTPLPGARSPGHFESYIVLENASPFPVSDVHVIQAVCAGETIDIGWQQPLLEPGGRDRHRLIVEPSRSWPALRDVSFAFTDIDGRRWRRVGREEPRRVWMFARTR
jgi:hypothetical protein